MCPLHLLNPSTNTNMYVHLVTAHFSQLTNTVLKQPAFIIACPGVHCVLKYQHWLIKRKIFLDQKVYQ